MCRAIGTYPPVLVLINHDESASGRDYGPTTIASDADTEKFPIPLRTFAHPAVVLELVIGLSPIAGVAFWGWDILHIVMLHLLAVAVQALFLALRAATLSRSALAYFAGADPTAADGAPTPPGKPWLSRTVLTGIIVLIVGLPLLLFVAIVSEKFGGASHAAVRSPTDFWRIYVVSSGLWIPLAFVALSQAHGFAVDAVLPRISVLHFAPPLRPVGPQWAHLSAELRAFLHVRAVLVVQMVVTVIGIGLGLVLAPALGAIAVALLLLALRTAAAVVLEAASVQDIEEARDGTGR